MIALAQWCVLLWQLGFAFAAIVKGANENTPSAERRQAILEIVVRFLSLLVLDTAGCFNHILH